MLGCAKALATFVALTGIAANAGVELSQSGKVFLSTNAGTTDTLPEAVPIDRRRIRVDTVAPLPSINLLTIARVHSARVPYPSEYSEV